MRLLLCVFLSLPCMAQFPKVVQGDFQSNDSRFAKPVPASKNGELTVVSFNIRNLGARGRGIANYMEMLKTVSKADIIVIQEFGLGIYDDEATQSQKESAKARAVVSWFQIFLGDEWKTVSPLKPSGLGSPAESSLLAYRTKGKGFDINVTWDSFVDLGNELRDMATFKVHLNKGGATQTWLLGSVHLKPDDPIRGKEMKKVAAWLKGQSEAGSHALVMGDFNWGYNKAPRVENYLGEDAFEKLHTSGVVYQLFRELSYRGNGKPGSLRTTSYWLKHGHFYDQFFMTPKLASQLAQGGKLQKDCGIVMIGKMKPMKGEAKKLEKKNLYALTQFEKQAQKKGVDLSALKAHMDHAREKAKRKALDDSTWIGSDHRPIWVKFKPF